MEDIAGYDASTSPSVLKYGESNVRQCTNLDWRDEFIIQHTP